MPKIVEPDSALDWYTLGQLCEAAGREIIAAAPNDPVTRRIDLFRDVNVDGRRITVRVKLTAVYVHRRKDDR
jgi:hypothetical protein